MIPVLFKNGKPAKNTIYRTLVCWRAFKNEKKIAQAVGFDFTKNKLEHQNLLEELHRIIDELKAMNGIWSEKAAKKYFQYLCDWLTGHVIEEDMLMKPVLQTREYHFHG